MREFLGWRYGAPQYPCDTRNASRHPGKNHDVACRPWHATGAACGAMMDPTMKVRFCLLLLWLSTSTCVLADPVRHFGAEPLRPFSYAERGQAVGPVPEVLQAVCKAAALECDVIMQPWRRDLAMAEQGDLDGLALVLPVVERQAKFVLTEPILRSTFTFFAPRDSGFHYRGPNDLNGMTIAVYGPSGASATLSDLIEGTTGRMEMEVSNDMAVQKLTAGRYGHSGALFANREVARDLIHEHHAPDLTEAGEAKTIDYCIALSRERFSPTQAMQFNQAVRRLKQDGTLRAILRKYGMEAAP